MRLRPLLKEAGGESFDKANTGTTVPEAGPLTRLLSVMLSSDSFELIAEENAECTAVKISSRPSGLDKITKIAEITRFQPLLYGIQAITSL